LAVADHIRTEKQRGSSLAREVEKGRVTEEYGGAILSHVRGVTSLEELADCDLVIESIIEDMDEKKKLLAALDGLCPEKTLFTTNTSSLPVIALAAATRRADRVVGTHFHNPPHVMKLVEVARTIASSDEAVGLAKAFCESLGKKVIVVQDTPGFIVNKIIVPYFMEGVRALEAGLGTAEDIDQAMVLGGGHPFGPLAILDLVGLDTICVVAESLYDQFKDPKYAPPPLLKRMVLAGYFGRKVGKGFYDYPTKATGSGS